MCYGRNPEMLVVKGHFTWHVVSREVPIANPSVPKTQKGSGL
jgi:hypothetical protein